MKTTQLIVDDYLIAATYRSMPSKLLKQVKKRLGILPNSFLIDAETPEIIERQWESMKFSYLDNPLSSLFKERLFVYLSSFCKVRYCLVRHVGFLNGLGYPSGDKNCLSQSVEEIVRLLKFKLPHGNGMKPFLALCHALDAPLEVLPDADTKMEKAIFACAAHVFLLTPDAAKSKEALQKTIEASCFNYLILLLSYIRITHNQAELHPEMAYEEDVRALMNTNGKLTAWLLKKPELQIAVISQKLPGEPAPVSKTSRQYKNLSGDPDVLLQENQELRKKEKDYKIELKAYKDLKQQIRLLELLENPIIVWNLAGNIEIWNTGTEKHYGYTKAEAIGKHIHELLMKDHSAASSEILEALATKGEWAGELCHKGKNGECIFVDSRQLLFGEKGHELVLETNHNITNRKRTENALRESEERLKMAANVAGFGIHDYLIEQDSLYWAPELKAIHGMPADTQTAFTEVMNIVHPDDRAVLLQKIHASFLPENNGEFDHEYRIQRIDNGETRWMFNRSHVSFSDTSGERKPVRNIGIVMDITERKLAERKLLESEEQYRMLFNSIDEALCIVEVLFNEANQPVDYRFLEVNPAFERHTGLQNVTGKRMLEIAPQHEAYWFDLYGKVALTGEPVRYENRAEQINRFFDVYAFKVGNTAEKKVAVLFTDISKRKVMEQQQEEFIGIASHELKTPVTSIKAYAEILQEVFEETKDTRSVMLIHKLNTQVDRLINLIRTLLDSTKISEGHLYLHLVKFNFDSLIAEKVEELQHLSSKHRIVWQPVNNLCIIADRERMGQVLTNLISNAIKYSPNCGEIVIICLKDKNGITVSIKDSGIGIPAEMQLKVFERFYRVRHLQVQSFPGMGLGLYITAGIIYQHGGTIKVESNTNNGSTFSFTLPAIDSGFKNNIA